MYKKNIYMLDDVLHWRIWRS